VLCFTDLGDYCKNVGFNSLERMKSHIFSHEPRNLQIPQSPLHRGYLGSFSVLKRKTCPSLSSSATKYNRTWKDIFPYLKRFLKKKENYLTIK